MPTPRIVSLVPSLTHAVCDLGLKKHLVGCTQFCVEPPDLRRTAVVVGGTKDPALAEIAALRPTHILVNEEENKPEHIEACRALAPTYLSFPKAPRDVPGMLRQMGEFLDCRDAAESWVRKIEAVLTRVYEARAFSTLSDQRCLYYIWREPYMVAAADTYINAMLELAGLVNVAPGQTRYPELPVAAAAALRPDVLLLSSEPYPFRRRDLERLKGEWPNAILPTAVKADGQLFSWYGTMTLAALEALRAWMLGEDQVLVSGFKPIG
jgi:ABC-type hemin transport system substrate-binding protein